jgi:hypothetical protein
MFLATSNRSKILLEEPFAVGGICIYDDQQDLEVTSFLTIENGVINAFKQQDETQYTTEISEGKKSHEKNVTPEQPFVDPVVQNQTEHENCAQGEVVGTFNSRKVR